MDNDSEVAEAQRPMTQFTVNFDLTKRHDREYIPRGVERAIWASLNAQQRNASYIPHFQGFERHGMIASLALKVFPIRLRQVIGNRLVMQYTGQDIIKGLLLGMMELRIFRLTLRDITPTNIALSDDHRQLQFCVLDNIARHCR